MPFSTESELPRASAVKTWVLWSVLAVWLVGSAGAFWYFELRHERAFVSAAHATLFESGRGAPEAEQWFARSIAGRPLTEGAAVATVVHVFDARCPCNRFTEPHLSRIESRYGNHDVRFVRVAMGSAVGRNAPRWIESTPAALVFDGAGKLVYFGPYSDAAACGTTNGLVERVLDQVLSGRSPQPQLVISGGCFCTRQPDELLGIAL